MADSTTAAVPNTSHPFSILRHNSTPSPSSRQARHSLRFNASSLPPLPSRSRPAIATSTPTTTITTNAAPSLSTRSTDALKPTFHRRAPLNRVPSSKSHIPAPPPSTPPRMNSTTVKLVSKHRSEHLASLDIAQSTKYVPSASVSDSRRLSSDGKRNHQLEDKRTRSMKGTNQDQLLSSCSESNSNQKLNRSKTSPIKRHASSSIKNNNKSSSYNHQRKEQSSSNNINSSFSNNRNLNSSPSSPSNNTNSNNNNNNITSPLNLNSNSISISPRRHNQNTLSSRSSRRWAQDRHQHPSSISHHEEREVELDAFLRMFNSCAQAVSNFFLNTIPTFFASIPRFTMSLFENVVPAFNSSSVQQQISNI